MEKGSIRIGEVQEKTGYDADEVLLLLNLLAPQLSIDYEFDDGHVISDILPSNENIEENYEENEKREKLIEFIRFILTDEEFKIISLHYGLNGNKILNNIEISKVLSRKITPERVRQIKQTAIRKLMNAKGIDEFAIYMDNPDKCRRKNSI